jgi:hypothetical protein
MRIPGSDNGFTRHLQHAGTGIGAVEFNAADD